MMILYDKVREIVYANQTGPKTYLYPIYRFYFPIVSNKMKALTESIFAQYKIPDLPVTLSKNIFIFF